MYLESETSTMSSNGTIYSINGILRDTEHLPIQRFKVSDLKWILEGVDFSSPEDQRRILAADLSAPILVTRLTRFGLVTVDGAHRLAKAIQHRVHDLPGKLVPASVMKNNVVKRSLAHESAEQPAWLRW